MTQTHRTSTGRSPRRLARFAAVAVAAALVLTGCLSADQQADLDLMNAARKSNRLTALNSDAAAASKAQAWSQSMARTGKLEHTGGGSKLDTSGLTKWCSVGENVGKGSSVQVIHDAFMRSSEHKANILGRYDRVGVGVYKSGKTYWVTEIFIRSC